MVAALLATTPCLAVAGVDTQGLPPVHPISSGLAGKPVPPTTGLAPVAVGAAPTASAKSQRPRYVVPIIHAGGAPDAAKVWKQAIATPPEGVESASTRKLAEQALTASRAADKTLPVVKGQDGGIISLGGRPVLVCSPLHTCAIELPRGVQPVVTVGVSKSEWSVQQAMVGDQGEVFVSPKFAGLHENIIIAGTVEEKPVNFNIRLVSDANRYIPYLRIAGSGELVHQWGGADKAGGFSPATSDLSGPGHKAKEPAVLPLPNIDLAKGVNKNWSIQCGGGGWFSSSDCQPIKPLQVYDDGTHTFIEMPGGLASHGGFPILQAKNTSGHLIGVNTQIRGNTYVVDSVPAEITLRAGSEVAIIRRRSGGHQ
ncbi:MAG: TrbG/VirB9 family P-type conjugative transfer protein [Acidithiobacillus sp.]